jgi:hypothetical protein
MKRQRTAVAVVCALILLGRAADIWWLVLPALRQAGPFWLDVTAMLALGGPMLLLFVFGLRYPARFWWGQRAAWMAKHG